PERRYSELADEALERPEAYALTLLGVEDARPDVVAADARDEVDPVRGGGGDHAGVGGNRMIGVHEVHPVAVRHLRQRGNAALDPQLVPAHVRGLPLRIAGEAHHPAPADAEP